MEYISIIYPQVYIRERYEPYIDRVVRLNSTEHLSHDVLDNKSMFNSYESKAKVCAMTQVYKFIVFAVLLILSGCVGTKAGAYKVFSDDLDRLKGVSITDAYVWNLGYIRDQKPNTVKALKNGNEIWEYRIDHKTRSILFWGKLNNEVCTVYLEVDVIGNEIVSASSRGKGCWRAY